MLFLLKLVLSMGKGACISILTLLILYPALAKLCLNLQLIVVGQNTAIASESEGIAGTLFVFLRYPCLLDIVAFEELVLVL